MRNFNQFYRAAGGSCLIVAGAIAAVALSFHPSQFIPGSAANDLWSPVHLALLIAFTLSVIGQVGVFSFLKDEVTVLNMAASMIGLVGSIWSVSVIIIEVFSIQQSGYEATLSMPLGDVPLLGHALNKLSIFFFVAVSLWLTGWMMTGIALVMSKKLPAYIGYILIASCLGFGIVIGFTDGGFEMLHIVLSLCLGISWLLLGNYIRKYDHIY